MLFLGLQFVVWSISGAYMVFFDLDYIHGDSLVKNHQTKISAENIHYSLAQLVTDYPEADNISIGKLITTDVYRFTYKQNLYLVDATNGKVLSPLSKDKIVALAEHYYAGQGEIINTGLINDNPPFELNQRYLPAWRIDFDHYSAPTLYISAQHGELVGKRHQFWRLFDWMFRFHIMDYGEQAKSSNLLLFYITLLSVIACLTGLVLTYVKVVKPVTKSEHSRKRISR